MFYWLMKGTSSNFIDVCYTCLYQINISYVFPHGNLHDLLHLKSVSQQIQHILRYDVKSLLYFRAVYFRTYSADLLLPLEKVTQCGS